MNTKSLACARIFNTVAWRTVSASHWSKLRHASTSASPINCSNSSNNSNANISTPFTNNAGAHTAISEFTPKDNSSPSFNADKYDFHEEWTEERANTAMRNHSLFTWGASTPLLESAVHFDSAEGVWLKTKDGNQFLDWSSGAVCSNIGHSVPASVKAAITEQLDKLPFVYGMLCKSHFFTGNN